MSNNYTVGIIGAMDCEIANLIANMSNHKEEKNGNIVIHTGELFRNKVIIIKSGVGKVNAALCTQYIIDRYNPNCIVNTGIAGGISPELSVGDIVIGKELIQYDFDVSAIGYARGYMCTGVNKDKPTVFHSDSILISNIEKAILEFASEIKVHKGVIATGDTFVSDINKKYEIRDIFNAMAVEMEGCAIAQVCEANKIPYVIVRAISDLADDKAAKAHEFVEEEMAELSSKAIIHLLKYINKETILN